MGFFATYKGEIRICNTLNIVRIIGTRKESIGVEKFLRLQIFSDRRRSRSPIRRRRDESAERICIELKNLPHRATAMDLEE